MIQTKRLLASLGILFLSWCLLAQTPGQTTIHLVQFMYTSTKEAAARQSNLNTLALHRNRLVPDLRALGFRVNEACYQDDAFSLANLTKAISQLRVAPNDVIVFVYSGPGSSAGPSATPTLNVATSVKTGPGARINLSVINQSLLAKKARMTVVVANTGTNIEKGERRPGVVDRTKSRRQNLLDLFTRFSGNSLMWSARQKEVPGGNLDGSYFGNGFFYALYESRDWNEVQQLTARKTHLLAVGPGRQDPQFIVACKETTSRPGPAAPREARTVRVRADARVRTFLGDSVTAIIAESEEVRTYLLHPLRHDGRTFAGFAIRKPGPVLTPGQAGELRSILLSQGSYNFAPVMKNCVFTPVLGVEFRKGAQRLFLLVCTDCDVWRFRQTGYAREEDFDPAHARVVAYLKKLIPNDPIISTIQ